MLDQLAAEAERSEQLQHELEKAKDRAEQLQVSKDAAMEEARRNADNTKEAIARNDRLTGQKADLEKKVADLGAERDKSQQRAVASEAKLKGAEEQLVSSKHELEKEKLKSSNEEDKRRQAEKSLGSEQAKAAALAEQLEAEKRKAADLEKRNAVLQEADRQLAEQKQKLESQIYALRGEKNDARKELQQAKDELGRKESDLQAAVARNASAEKEASERLDTVISQLAAEAEQADDLRKENSQVRNEADSERSQMTRTIYDLKDQLSSAETHIRHDESQRDLAREQLNAQKEQIRLLQDRLADHQNFESSQQRISYYYILGIVTY